MGRSKPHWKVFKSFSTIMCKLIFLGAPDDRGPSGSYCISSLLFHLSPVISLRAAKVHSGPGPQSWLKSPHSRSFPCCAAPGRSVGELALSARKHERIANVVSGLDDFDMVSCAMIGPDAPAQPEVARTRRSKKGLYHLRQVRYYKPRNFSRRNLLTKHHLKNPAAKNSKNGGGARSWPTSRTRSW